MLIRISELFELPVSELLGAEIKEEKNRDEVALQLALLNENLANKSKRNKKLIKRIIICVIIAIVLSVIVTIIAAITYNTNIQTSTLTELELICTLDGHKYYYNISYDDNYIIRSQNGAEFIRNHVDTEKYEDPDVLIAQIEDYFSQHGGKVEVNE